MIRRRIGQENKQLTRRADGSAIRKFLSWSISYLSGSWQLMVLVRGLSRLSREQKNGE